MMRVMTNGLRLTKICGMKPRKPPDPAPRTPVLSPYHHFDPIPQPEVIEHNTETSWKIWKDLHERDEKRFADTQPMTQPAGLPPATAAPVPARPIASKGKSGLEKAIEESRRNNRVCPRPAKWQELDALLRTAAPEKAVATLPPPLPPGEWQMTTSLAKRLMFRDVINWAGKHAMVEPLLDFERALPEEQWHHMGD
jgi:hypothetical protein